MSIEKSIKNSIGNMFKNENDIEHQNEELKIKKAPMKKVKKIYDRSMYSTITVMRPTLNLLKPIKGKRSFNDFFLDNLENLK